MKVKGTLFKKNFQQNWCFLLRSTNKIKTHLFIFKFFYFKLKFFIYCILVIIVKTANILKHM